MEVRPLYDPSMAGGAAPFFAPSAVAPMPPSTVGGGAGAMMPMNIQMLAQGAMQRVMNICTWELNNKDDPRRMTTHIILRHRTLKHGNRNYYPGVLNLTRPPWFADVISEEDWKNNLMKFNRAVYDWWYPGDIARTTSIFLGAFMLFPLICYFACDETGDCCFKNRKKIQLMRVAQPILKELSYTTPFEWTLEWRPELFERADAVQDDFKTLQVCLRLKEPIAPQAPAINQSAFGNPSMMGGLSGMFQAPQQVPVAQAVPIYMSHMQK
jgi:hypothetical protein